MGHGCIPKPKASLGHMRKRRFRLPNCITVLRMAGTLCLLFTRPLSPAFLVIYTFTGLTDVLDGYIARKTHTESELGAKLDSIADLLFYAVMLFMLFPTLWELLPTALWCTVGVTLLLRFSSYMTAAVKYHRFASMHTYMNKITGGMVFLIPYILTQPFAVYVCWVICVIAAAASAEELLIHLREKEYRPNTRGIMDKKK